MSIARALPPALLAVAVAATMSAVPLALFDQPAGLGALVVVLSALGVGSMLAGAVLAANLADAGADRPALVAGAVAVAVGATLLAVGSRLGWPWLLGGGLVIGLAQGMLLVLAFVRAARVSPWSSRPWAVGGVLAGVGLGGFVSGVLSWLGIALLVVAGLATAILALVLARSTAPVATGLPTPSPLTAGIGAVLAAIGLLVLEIAADATRASLVVFLPPLRGDIGAVDDTRIVLAVSGAALLALGAWLGLGRLRRWAMAWRATLAVAALAFLAGVVPLPASMAATMHGQALPTWTVIAPAGLVGLVVGAWWAAATGRVRMPALAGAALAALGVTVAGWAWLTAGVELWPVTLGGAALVGAGAGLGLVALRAYLADAPWDRLGSATAAGVIAVVAGGQLGGVVGASELVSLAFGEPRPTLGVALVVAVTAGALALTLAGPRDRLAPHADASAAR